MASTATRAKWFGWTEEAEPKAKKAPPKNGRRKAAKAEKPAEK